VTLRKLLSIEEVFAIEGRGLVLFPDFPPGRTAKAEAAELRRPDGVVIPVRMTVAAEHRSLSIEAARAGARSAARVCLIHGVSKSDVVLGSELWCDDALAQDLLGQLAHRDDGEHARDPRNHDA
jgi:hypothetical protein